MEKVIFFSCVLAATIAVSWGGYEDQRCRCICPPKNATDTRKVYIEPFKDPAMCKCENVVSTNPDFCSKCSCEWQKRNTTTIKVVVIIIICVISLLVLYMLFLLCLDPLMSRRPKTYMEQRNEEDTSQQQPADTQSMSHMVPDSVRPRVGVMSRVKHEVNRVKGEQEKWKGTVKEQRKIIFDRHTMLN